MRFQLFKKDYIVGLDIGSSSVKIAQFARREDGLHLVKAEVKEIKGTDDSLLRENELISVVKDLFRAIDIRKSTIITSINCPKTAIKITRTPYIPRSELREGINLEAKNYFPFPIDESLLDFEILGDVVEKGVRKYEVLVAVSPRETVDRYLSLLGKVGIKPASLVPSSYLLQRLVEHLPAREKDTRCFIDIGKLHAELAIFKGSNLVFSRKVPVTGDDFTKAMTGVLVSDRGKTALTSDEAEKIKREIGIPSEVEPKIIDDKISTTQILSMLRTPLEHIVNEIERCFDYYREESGGEKIDSILLFGGGASLGGLIKFLSEELDIEVALGDPLEGLDIEENAIDQRDSLSYRLELAIGAALSGGKGINLLPPEIKEEIKRVFKRSAIEAITTAVVLASVLIYIGMKIQLSNFSKRISVAKMELSSLQPQLKKAEAYHLANMVLVDEPHWEDIFRELSNLIPDDIYLTNLNMDNSLITMEGVVDSEDAEQLLSDFILTLEKGIFKNVKLIRIEDLDRRAGSEFELSCWVD